MIFEEERVNPVAGNPGLENVAAEERRGGENMEKEGDEGKPGGCIRASRGGRRVRYGRQGEAIGPGFK